MIETILVILIPIITIIIVIWGIMKAGWYWYELPTKKIYAIAERNGKKDPYNWVFVTGIISWPAVFLYWLFNEKNKKIGSVFQLARNNKKILFVIGLFIIIAIWFYWSQWRPAEIRKSCSRWVENAYLRCIHDQGLDK